MAVDQDRAAYVALALTPGIGPVRLSALLNHFQSAHGALSAPFAFLCTVPGISPAAATAIGTSRPADGARVLRALEVMGARCLLPDDPEFPAALLEVPDPPSLLFTLGDLDLLRRPAVAVVGSRDHSPYGAAICHDVARAAAQAGIAVVSGMARGLDAIAHTAALDVGGTTIGILGNGLGVVYPAANRALYRRVADHGLLLTEFPPGERPGVGAFPRRNRLISGLARVTVVIEAAEASGTLITVGTALAQGRDVMAVPGNITSPTSAGTNRLIRDGAEPLLAVGDLLEHYPEARAGEGAEVPPPPAAPPPELRPPEDLTRCERRLFDLLGGGSKQLDALIALADHPTHETLAALGSLEVRGVAVNLGGVVRLAVHGPRAPNAG